MPMEFWFARKHVLWVVINLMCLISGYESCLQEERLGLLSIRDYFQSDGVRTELVFPSWTYDLSSDCCSWERVKCNSTTGLVIELALNAITPDYYFYEQFLNASLFLPFEELRNLDLHENWFTDCYQNHGFEKMSSLKKLEVLDLSHNLFRKNTLPSLGTLISLRTLNLSDNGFEGSFPVKGFEKMSSLKKLEVLDLSHNFFRNNNLSSLGALISLRTLNLRGNLFEGSFPVKELKAIKHLETLDLSRNHLSDPPIMVQDFKALKNLMVLNLESNRFNSNILPFVSTLTSLRTLNLGSNNLRAFVSATELASLENLEQLDLSWNQLENISRIVHGLLRLQKLEVLNLEGNPITKSSLKSLGAITSLKNLYLASCKLDGAFAVQDLASLKNLEILDLSHNRLNGSLTMLAELAVFQKLEILDLSYNEFSGDIFQFLGHMTSLKALSLASNNMNGSITAQEGLCSLKNLQELDLSNNYLSGVIPPCLGNLTSLRFLDLSLNKLEGDISSSPIAALKSLEYIDLRNNLFWGQFSFYSIANHTNLKVLMLTSDNPKLEVQSHYSHEWLPTFQLKVLVMSNCRLNNIPQILTHQTGLRVIDLSHNNLTETFPNWLLENNAQLTYLNLRNNSLMGQFSLSTNSSFAIEYLDISDNGLHGQLQQNFWDIIPNARKFNLSANGFEGGILFSVGNMPHLEFLDLSNNFFSGEVPDTLVTNSSKLAALLLSHNRFSGQMPKTKSNITSLMFLQLSGNQFTGTLSNWISHYPWLSSVDISDNFMSGEIPGFIGNLSLLQLNIANNALEGTIPCELLSTSRLSFLDISFLDISYNNLSGTLPSCLKWSSSLKHLNLEGNRLTGSIPETFFNSSRMTVVNIGNNCLSGEIPTSVGNLSSLRVLQLSGNSLSGLIPEQLCQLNELSILDLSHNSFSGPIPTCFSLISFGKVDEFDFAQDRVVVGGESLQFYDFFQSNLEQRSIDMGFLDTMSTQRAYIELVTKTRSSIYKGSLLELMSGLDLSCNQLTGEIPAELGNLSLIRVLNFSYNQLTGSIPKSLNNLGQLESLDLSHNKLSREIPSGLISLHFLSYFSVAYNNLSGRLPDMKGQFSTFDNKSYEGNPFLCGPPLDTSCGAEFPQLPPSSDTNSGKWHDIIDPVSFLSSFMATYLVFLSSFAIVLYINPYWRRRLFMFIENFIDECHFLIFYTIPKLFARLCRKAYCA